MTKFSTNLTNGSIIVGAGNAIDDIGAGQAIVADPINWQLLHKVWEQKETSTIDNYLHLIWLG